MTAQAPGPAALSVCIPAYNRPALLEVALRSVLSEAEPLGDRLHVVVSDDSTVPHTAEVCRRQLADWGGVATYRRNSRSLGMAANWNRCVELARGHHVLILHDDDFLLPGALAAIVGALDSSAPPPEVLLFGVDVVDPGGRRRRRQAVRHRRYLPPERALAVLLADSSFVRFPGMVVSRRAYRAVGPFDEAVGEVADLFMWARLLAAHGLQQEAAVTAAYRIHHGALTTGMWRPDVLRAVRRVFDDDAVTAVVGGRERRRLQGRWMSQFVLAGAWRRLRAGDPAGVLAVLDLLDDPSLGHAPIPVSRRAGRRVLAAVARGRGRSRRAAEQEGGTPPGPAVLLERPADGAGSQTRSLEDPPASSGEQDPVANGERRQHPEDAGDHARQAARGGA